MLGKKLLATCLSLIFAFGSTTLIIAETPENPETPTAAEEAVEPAVEETPTEEPSEVPEQKLLSNADLRILGGELSVTGKRLRRSYNGFSIVPGTWRWIEEEMDKGEAFGAAFLAIFILPVDFALSRTYGNFVGSYHLGPAGNHLIAASEVFPPEQAALMVKSGNNLKSCRTYGLLSNALFYGGIILALSQSSDEDGGAAPYAAIGSIITSYGLRLLSVHYAGSAGRALYEISESPLSNEPLKAMGAAGMELEGYEYNTYLGYGITAGGITIAILGKDNDNAVIAGALTAIAGWIVSSPVAVSNIKGAANKLQEVGDRLMFWQE